jgi:Helix-turn-helix domain
MSLSLFPLRSIGGRGGCTVCASPLHDARVTGGIRLSEVAARTCLSPRIVRLIDAGEFDCLPGGLYARSYVRAFADAVGLNPESALRELAERLPPAEDPLPVLRESTRGHLSPWLAQIWSWNERLQAALAARLARCRSQSRRGRHSKQYAAAGVDLGILLVFYLGLLRLTAWIAGVDLRTALEIGGVEISALWAIVALLYFGILGRIGGMTAGVLVCKEANRR